MGPADKPPSLERLIYLIGGRRVMLDADLAELYSVKTFNLNKAARRNPDRFPGDFMFQLWSRGAAALRFQIGISKSQGRGGRRYLPYAFTEQGVAMLSSVLRSPKSAQVNIAIMRAFVKLRRTLALHKGLAAKLRELERRIVGHDDNIRSIFDAIRALMAPPTKPSRRIGFTPFFVSQTPNWLLVILPAGPRPSECDILLCRIRAGRGGSSLSSVML